MAVKVEYSANMQRKSFHVFLGLAIGKYEAPMELFKKKLKNEPWSLTGKVGRIEIQMRTEIAVCRGWASLLAVNGFASCPSPGPQQTCDHPKSKNTTLSLFQENVRSWV
jgi:hypothetical protein